MHLQLMMKGFSLPYFPRVLTSYLIVVVLVSANIYALKNIKCINREERKPDISLSQY